MKALAIGLNNVTRMLRERSNIFFVFIFPIAIVLLVGIQFGSAARPAIGVQQGDDGVIAGAIVTALEADGSVDVSPYETGDELIRAIELGTINVGLLIPARMDTDAAEGEKVDIGYVSRPDGSGAQLQSLVSSVVADVMAPVGAAQFAAAETGASFDTALTAADAASQEIDRLDVRVTTTGEALFPASLGQFDLGASSQLVLFVFLIAVAGASALILTRQLGISKRMLATPTSVGTIVLGEGMGRFFIAIFQGVYIMVLTAIIFGVNWGDPLGAALLLIAFSAVGAGAGILMGATFSNDQQAGGVGVILSLGLAALGGAMVPAELFSSTMQRVAHLTPHAWALDGFAELVRHDGTTLDILPELGVLVLYAVVIGSLAAWRLRVAITRP